MQSVIMLNFVMLSVVILSVAAPFCEYVSILLSVFSLPGPAEGFEPPSLRILCRVFYHCATSADQQLKVRGHSIAVP